MHHPAPICLYSGLADAYRGSGIWLKRNVNERDYVGLRPLKYLVGSLHMVYREQPRCRSKTQGIANTLVLLNTWSS